MQEAAPPRTVFLHIGTEKTGTTTIQALASQNRHLLERHGLFYPKTPGDANHIGLTLFASDGEARHGLPAALKLCDETQIREYVNSFASRLKDELDASSALSILFSNEHLSARLRKPAGIRRLTEMLHRVAGSVTVIVYLRPQHELLLSAYSTSVKSGSTRALQVDKTGREHLFNYDKMLRLWEDGVGISNIRVRLFSRSEFTHGSLIDDFFTALNLSAPGGLLIPSDRNRALDAETLDFLRIANATQPRIIDGRIDPSRQKMLSALEKISGSRQNKLPLGEIETLCKLYAVSNQRVAERYFPDRTQPLFPAPTAGSEAPGPSLTLERAMEIAAALWREGHSRSRN